MKAVNKATAMMLDRFRGRMRQRVEAGGENPLTEMDTVRQQHGQSWDEAREGVVGALRLWLVATLGGCMLTVLREIAACAAAAEAVGGKAKEAADELGTSWEFLQQVMGTWLEGVDVEHIAEVLLDDYVEKYANAPPAATDPFPSAADDEFAAPSDAAPDAAAMGSALERLLRRARPSAN
jgi:hypothetical protein